MCELCRRHDWKGRKGGIGRSSKRPAQPELLARKAELWRNEAEFSDHRNKKGDTRMVMDVSTDAEGAAEVGAKRRTRSSSIDLDVNSPVSNIFQSIRGP